MTKRQKYFLIQKIIGALALIFAGLTVPLLDGDVTAAVFIAPAGWLMLFSKDMILTSDYYFEVTSEKGEL